MTILDYYKEHHIHIFGEKKANRIIENSQLYLARIDETAPPDGEGETFSSDLRSTIFPMIGLYRAMICEGFTEKEVGSFLKTLWDIAPDEIKHAGKN